MGVSGIAKPFIPWIGSKEKLIPYIWQVFPPNPKLYLEPFGGGGALLLGIQPKISRMDIYNDFNCDLVNLFLCARECTVQLVQELKFLPLHSRAEFDLLKEFMKHKELLQQRIILQTQAKAETIKHNSSHRCVVWRKEKEGLRDAVEEKSRHWFLIAVPWNRTFWGQLTTFHTCRRGWDRHDDSLCGG